MKVACLQINTGDLLSLNLENIDLLLQRAAEQKVKLAALPENFAFMHPDLQRKRDFARQDCPATVLPFLAAAAQKYHMAIIAGSVLLEGRQDKLRNACPVYDRNGACLGIYDKMHLFDVDLPDGRYHESAQIEAGDTPLVVQLDEWRLGVSICYDLRFPELYRYYSALGCNLLSIPAAFTVPTGQAHWEVLLRARAIENQAYVLAPAQIGTHPGGRQTYGHSMIIAPWGEIVAQASNHSAAGGELIVGDIELNTVSDIRRKMPAWRHEKL
ncbi:carbon-nitrogen hydrolase family protein [Geopsychrobacter electrodiphilus]|uniref:carbon-nitrogen hydrolase family protein n=1 Tax=Geopsychrobacter electrodiphilus TaxID=225196 RepID=UPI0003776E5A|nr:carbon-nitrogen hydrolase family protein [Geopsychrobacter electrodiphilus]